LAIVADSGRAGRIHSYIRRLEMLREFLCSMALVVSMSAPGLADINQNQGFAVGMNSAINLLGGWGTAGDSKFLAVQLGQTTQGPSLLAIQDNIAFSQVVQPLTSGASLIAVSFGSIAGGLQVPGSVIPPLNGGQLSLLNNLPLLLTD